MQITTTKLYSKRTASLQANGWYVLDATVKSGEKAFAPSWDIVMGYKKGEISEEEYTQTYLSMMRESFKSQHAAWEKIILWEKLAIACYCPPGDFCHRHLLKEYVKAWAEKNGLEVTILDESHPEWRKESNNE